MTPKGPRAERETIINFNEEDETATVWTASTVVYRKLLKRLGRAYLTEEGERHAVFTFPVRFIRLPIIGKPMSDARRAVLSRARSVRTEKTEHESPETGGGGGVSIGRTDTHEMLCTYRERVGGAGE